LHSSNDFNSSPNGSFVNSYDSGWNRTSATAAADMAASLYSNPHYHYANSSNSSSSSSSSSTSSNSNYFNEANNLSNTSNSSSSLLQLPTELNMISSASGSSSPTSITQTNSLNPNANNKLSPKTLTSMKEEAQIGRGFVFKL